MSQIPLLNPRLARQRPSGAEPWMAAPLRYSIAVLALIAACVAARLTWETFGQGTLIGCSETDLIGCDQVLGSGWSKFLGMPVALGGLVCYTAIFVLSLLAGSRSDGARWVNTALVMLAALAVGAGAWFTALQFLAIGKICPRCLWIHACGLVIGGFVLWSAFSRRPSPSNASASTAALAGTLRVPSTGTRRVSYTLAEPSLSVASIGAVAALLLLVAGQIMFRPKSYDISKVALDDPIEMTATANGRNRNAADTSPDAQSHVVRRMPTGDDNDADDSGDTSEVDADTDAAATTGDAADESPAAESEPIDIPPVAKREVKFLDGMLTVDLSTEAILGSREAPYVILELMDYTCPHCREMHETLKLASRRYGNQLAIAVMPVPLELECNRRLPKTDPMHRDACRMARLAISLAKVDPSAFADFHNFLMQREDRPPPYGSAVVRAFRLVNRKQLSALTKSDEIEARIQDYIKLYATLASRQKSSDKPFGLPVQIVGDKVLSGKFDSPEEMFEAWEAELDIRPM